LNANARGPSKPGGQFANAAGSAAPGGGGVMSMVAVPARQAPWAGADAKSSAAAHTTAVASR
jgi:hypothetical protein